MSSDLAKLTLADGDIRLQAVLDREAHSHQTAADQARRDRRAVWLRLHEDHGYTYERLTTVTGYGSTTLLKELKRARREREAAR